jgi:hypothetical protein
MEGAKTIRAAPRSCVPRGWWRGAAFLLEDPALKDVTAVLLAESG